MYKLTREEQETNITITNDKENVIVYSSIGTHIKKLEGYGYVGEPMDKYGTKRFEIPFNEFNFSKRGKRNLSDEQRKAMSDRMRKTRDD